MVFTGYTDNRLLGTQLSEFGEKQKNREWKHVGDNRMGK